MGMTATERLRELLDERGVEHYDGTERALWGYEPTGVDRGVYRFAASEIRGGFVQLDMYRITPEQAIEATLGRGTCRADETDTWECVCDTPGRYGRSVTVHVMECSECGGTYEHVNGGYEYCPRCGRRIEVSSV